jgi:hypothetical protein
MSLDHVLLDLVPYDLVEYTSDAYTITYPPDARRYRSEPLTTLWPKMRAGHLEPDEERFLGALATLSEGPGEEYASVETVSASEVIAALGWAMDGPLALRVFGNLKAHRFADGTALPGYSISLRITYSGLVRLQPASHGRPIGFTIRTADELRARFCDWREADSGKVTLERFAEFLDVADKTIARHCETLGLPWKTLKTTDCGRARHRAPDFGQKDRSVS